MVYYRFNYYVKSSTVTDFAPYNFFYNVDTVIACKKPNNWYNLEFTYIFKLRNIQSMFTYMYIQHELQKNQKKSKKIPWTYTVIHQKKTNSFSYPLYKNCYQKTWFWIIMNKKNPQQHCLWLIYNARYPFFFW